MSSKWQAVTFAWMIFGATLCLLLFLKLDPDEIVHRVLIGSVGVVTLVGGVELLGRQYEFHQDCIKYRKRFRWHEYEVPRSLTLSVIEGAIWFTDNQARRHFLILTREFSRGGDLVDELSDFYNGHGRSVFIEREP